MSQVTLTISELYEIAEQYYGNELYRIEVCNIGIRFVCLDRSKGNEEYSAFFQTPLKNLSINSLRGFLDAETQEESISN
ncbi:hypothetical protein ACX9XP_004191 [Escherichia coli]|uniref:hypothetical protein n=1 Tax=Enterobacteriaceae TaxID=543 RepID=UPI000B95AF30|nr:MULTISPECIES: hypothetical protein [Enterobacteriaceae]HBC6265405.1 hypothetical protein [Citrobacter braakii]EEV0099761.1 hypothetical protein [Escherichia coli]EFC9681656.1 hypothetical protein [Escherichia coli]EFH5385179.1 hypothetical protein [Escherichia coli]EFH8034053.1 hypothetical protein [Escherichia coli]